MKQPTTRELKKLCKQNPDCYCPKEHEIKALWANLPMWLRRWIESK